MWSKTRKVARVVAEEPVSGSATNGGVHEISGRTRDLSTIGAFFYTDYAPELGSGIELLVNFPAEISEGQLPTQAICRGHVVRVEPGREEGSYGIAVEFESCERVWQS